MEILTGIQKSYTLPHDCKKGYNAIYKRCNKIKSRKIKMNALLRAKKTKAQALFRATLKQRQMQLIQTKHKPYLGQHSKANAINSKAQALFRATLKQANVIN